MVVRAGPRRGHRAQCDAVIFASGADHVADLVPPACRVSNTATRPIRARSRTCSCRISPNSAAARSPATRPAQPVAERRPTKRAADIEVSAARRPSPHPSISKGPGMKSYLLIDHRHRGAGALCRPRRIRPGRQIIDRRRRRCRHARSAPHPDTTAYRTADLIYAGLVHLTPSLEAKPDLAESWESPDPTTYIFQLRAGLKFSDGSPLTADDVVYTFTKHHRPKLQRARSRALQPDHQGRSGRSADREVHAVARPMRRC